MLSNGNSISANVIEDNMKTDENDTGICSF